jgi:hypothetical protein
MRPLAVPWLAPSLLRHAVYSPQNEEPKTDVWACPAGVHAGKSRLGRNDPSVKAGDNALLCPPRAKWGAKVPLKFGVDCTEGSVTEGKGARQEL